MIRLMGRTQRILVWCIWILCFLLATSSVDATPDPPALDPHFAAMKVPGPSGLAARIVPGNDSSLVPFPAPSGVVAEVAEPDWPWAVLAQMEQAADPSPPSFPESL